MSGKRIFFNRVRPSTELLNKFNNVVTPHVSDNMDRLWGASADLRPLHGTTKLIGVALTVKTRPGDNLLIHKALDMALPGDVIVVDGGGETKNALFGEIMMNLAMKKQVAGIVIDGAIRDVEAFRKANYPIYAKGITHLGPYKDGPGEINVPIEISSMIVNPGDIILGDEDGLIAIPLEEAESILHRIETYSLMEEKMIKEINEGTNDRSWIDKMLREKGYEFIQ